ncbi:GlxA family transcriptional regulator [Kiloniella sp.]|uniref:GlxA family transcriptional regulator n=1 Tax=Kiloniella sp. TaxID=1938587 RepID=UPI003B027ECA
MDEQKRDGLLLLSSYNPEKALSKALINWLRKQSRTGCLMGCVDTGALILAQAGLLSTKPVAAHFEAIAGYMEQFPQAMFVDKLFDFNPPLCSSAGGVATCDMTLTLIKHYSGSSISKRVAEILTYQPTEHTGPQKTLSPNQALSLVSRDTARAVNIMLSSIESPIPLSEISQQCEIPSWKLARLFKRYLHKTPGEYYLSLRLEHAQYLLHNSHHKIYTIASLCGFENNETFSRAYKRQFGMSPSKDRLSYNQ